MDLKPREIEEIDIFGRKWYVLGITVALDKLEALIQHNESPIDTWSENEYELNKTYAFDAVAFSDWLTSLRQEVLKDTLEKIDFEGIDTSACCSMKSSASR